MSINGAMLAGISGLRANSAALGAISTNIANVNTVGYKASQASFQTFLSSSRSSGSYSPGGVASTRARATLPPEPLAPALKRSIPARTAASIASRSMFGFG